MTAFLIGLLWGSNMLCWHLGSQVSMGTFLTLFGSCMVSYVCYIMVLRRLPFEQLPRLDNDETTEEDEDSAGRE